MLIYEGHDAKNDGKTSPKEVDQPEFRPSGLPTQNGRFAEAVRRHKGGAPPEKVRVYEQVQPGIWVYNGLFDLIDYWTEELAGRKVFKFKLKIAGADAYHGSAKAPIDLEDDRLIPSWVKLEVWKRDKGRCQKCKSNSGLHFDHIIPYSKGGLSKDPANIQIVCGRHNLAKSDNLEGRQTRTLLPALLRRRQDRVQ